MKSGPLKLLLVQPAVAPGRGGAQGVAAQLAIGFAERGHEVRLMGEYNSIPRLAAKLSQARVQIIERNIHTVGPIAVLGIIREIAAFRPDAVLSSQRAGDILATAAAFPFRSKVVASVGEKLPTAHDLIEPSWHKTRFHKYALKYGTKKIIATSEYARGHAIKYAGVNPTKVEVIPNGIDTSYFLPSSRLDPSETFGLPLEGKRIIGLIGRISREKRPRTLIEVVARLNAGGLNCAGIFIGDGTAREETEQHARGSEVSESIHFVGVRHDMPEVYRSLDMVVHFCELEGFGLVHVEALAMGTPIVATAGGAADAIIKSGLNGFLAPADDLGMFVKRCQQVLTDPGVTEKFMKAGREIVLHQFSIEVMVDKYESILRKL